ncbi:MAG: hypothetical protein ACETWE_12295 [Candidatus Bathyarchaeia archaeon]
MNKKLAIILVTVIILSSFIGIWAIMQIPEPKEKMAYIIVRWRASREGVLVPVLYHWGGNITFSREPLNVQVSEQDIWDESISWTDFGESSVFVNIQPVEGLRMYRILWKGDDPMTITITAQKIYLTSEYVEDFAEDWLQRTQGKAKNELTTEEWNEYAQQIHDSLLQDRLDTEEEYATVLEVEICDSGKASLSSDSTSESWGHTTASYDF